MIGRPSRPCVLRALTVLVLSVPTAAAAGPITFNTALPVHSGEIIVCEQVVWTRATTGPPPERADVNVVAVPSTLVWGAHTRVTLMASLPFLFKNAEVTSPSGERVHRGTVGFGDLSLLVRASAIQWDAPGRTVRLAPFAGTELPTGADDEADSHGPLPPDLQLGSGSFDPFVGVILTWQTLRFEVDLSASWTWRTAANDFDAGDEGTAEGSFQYRVVPWGELGSGLPTFLFAVLETRVDWVGADGGSRAADTTGGWSWFAAPGLQLVTLRHIVEAAVELPIIQPDGLHVDFVARVSYRASF